MRVLLSVSIIQKHTQNTHKTIHCVYKISIICIFKRNCFLSSKPLLLFNNKYVTFLYLSNYISVEIPIPICFECMFVLYSHIKAASCVNSDNLEQRMSRYVHNIGFVWFAGPGKSTLRYPLIFNFLNISRVRLVLYCIVIELNTQIMHGGSGSISQYKVT